MPLASGGVTPEGRDPGHLGLLLDDCIVSLIHGIRRYTDSQGILRDPVTGIATPSDHYGQVASALTICLWDHTGTAWLDLLKARAATPRPDLGHAPFNRFLLLLFRRALQDRKSSPKNLELIAQELARCDLDRSYPSNNWTLLARLCDLLDSDEGSKSAKSQGLLLRLLDSWLTPKGGFVDFPRRRPKDECGATPIAYHHKALFIATMAAAITRSPAWIDRVERMMGWALMCWDGDSHVGGLGRSTHALFGDACLVASLVMLGFGEGDRPRHPAQQMLEGILRSWRSQRRQDGLIGLNPSGDAYVGWDGYMHLSVYNAWAAALLSWGLHAAPSMDWTRSRAFWRNAVPGSPLQHDPGAGIRRCGDPTSAFMLINTRGQIPQGFLRHSVELRYAGGIPFHLAWRGWPLCPPPVRLAVTDLLECPARAGWTPIFQDSDQVLYGLTDWIEQLYLETDEALEIHLTGMPRQLTRDRVQGLLGRVRAALDWRLLNGRLGRSAALKRRSLTGLKATLQIRLQKDRPRLEWELALVLDQAASIRWLNPGAHALLSENLPSETQLAIVGEGMDDRIAQGSSCWAEHSMDASLPGALGRCLEPRVLHGGAHPLVLKGKLAWSL